MGIPLILAGLVALVITMLMWLTASRRRASPRSAADADAGHALLDGHVVFDGGGAPDVTCGDGGGSADGGACDGVGGGD